MSEKTIIEILADQVSQRPDALFMEFSTTGRQITYGEFSSLSKSFAQKLLALGVKKGELIALIFPNSIHSYIALFAAWEIGAIPMPINCNSARTEIESILDDHKIRKIIHHEAVKGEMDFKGTLSISLPEDLQPLKLAVNASGVPSIETDIDACALVLLTSGSTGKPKAVTLSQRNLTSNATSIAKRYAITENDKIMCVLPFSIANSIVITAIVPLISGASVSLHPVFDEQSVKTFWDTVAQNKITIASLVPAILTALNEEREKNLKNDLRFVFSATSYLSPLVQVEFEEFFNLPVYGAYGLTETTCWATSQPTDSERKLESVGLPLDCAIKVVDENGEEVKNGREGRIKIKGNITSAGYLDNPEATSELIDDDGWLDTEDVGKVHEDGQLFISYRIKNIIKKGAQNLSPEEVRSVLLKEPSVKEAYVLGLHDKTYGEVIGAALVLKPDGEGDLEKFNSFCSNFLAKGKTPDHYLFMENLPKVAIGKVDKAKLIKKFYEECETYTRQASHLTLG